MDTGFAYTNPAKTTFTSYSYVLQDTFALIVNIADSTILLPEHIAFMHEIPNDSDVLSYRSSDTTAKTMLFVLGPMSITYYYAIDSIYLVGFYGGTQGEEEGYLATR